MPVLTLDRDPILISIDLQRFEDLGIPAVPGHECAATFYGPMGVIRPVIFVPDGWQDALPDGLPLEEEWDHQVWEAALQDHSQEHRKHALPISPRDCLGAGIAAGVIMWFALAVLPVLVGILLSALSLSHSASSGNNTFSMMATVFLLAGALGGAIAPFAGRMIRSPNGIRTLIVLFLITGVFLIV